ncbi:hypothetical protein CAPTEDRAFT_211986 [Capitella teleta]|uniref:Ig-like domain-containing protein n=1 Tax=Capitella teleta TaxID=283909 RepID=R7T3M3_CAPTE|nr:hypothetical protein CAPTEDRAFT_211986 [Capitella teleta]|eukprot:ELT87387.1 hypothetical protein CAPTEDRAFT_211986 [Capitella teleta]
MSLHLTSYDNDILSKHYNVTSMEMKTPRWVGGSRAKSRDHDNHLPVFKDTNRNITASPGKRAVLKCRVENLGTKTVTWKRADQEHPLTIGLFPFVSDTRVTVDYNQRTLEWVLIIQDVKPDDEGIYQCQISTKHQHDKLSYDVKLNVDTVQVTGEDFVERGSTLKLVCNATGKPVPPHDVAWFKDGRKIESDVDSGKIITKKIDTKVLVSMLVIQRSAMSDQGEYECKSTENDSAKITVKILDGPKPNNTSNTVPAILMLCYVFIVSIADHCLRCEVDVMTS